MTRLLHGLKPATEKRKVKYYGLCRAASQLKVTRQHLYFVLEGQRRSPRIERSQIFQQLKGGQ